MLCILLYGCYIFIFSGKGKNKTDNEMPGTVAKSTPAKKANGGLSGFAEQDEEEDS